MRNHPNLINTALPRVSSAMSVLDPDQPQLPAELLRLCALLANSVGLSGDQFTGNDLAVRGFHFFRSEVAADTTVNEANQVVAVTTAGIEVELASIAVTEGSFLIIKDESGSAGTSTITVTTEGDETIDGAASYVINSNYGSVAIYCDGSNWLILYSDAGGAASSGGLENIVEDTTPQLGGNLDVNGNEIVSIDNRNIQLTPDGTGSVLLFFGSSGASAHGSANDLVVENDASAGISILTPNNANANLYFGDPEDNDVGQIVYTHSGNHMLFYTNGAENMRLDLNGRLGVGTSPSAKIHVAGSAAFKRVGTATDVNSDDEVFIGVTDTSVARTVTIQTADLLAGRFVVVKDESGGAGTNNITIATQGAETIDGAATATISTNYDVVRLYSDGSNWFTW